MIAAALGALFALNVSQGATGSVPLAHRPERILGIALPPNSRSELPEGVIPIEGQWRLVASAKGVRTWQIALPVRPRTLVYTAAPEGMEVVRRDPAGDWSTADTLGHGPRLSYSGRKETWEFSAKALRVRRSADLGPPRSGEYGLRYDKALEREQQLQRESFDGSDEEFIFRRIQVDNRSRSGALLPAPGRLRMSVSVPQSAVLEFGALLMPPEVLSSEGESDGVEVVVLANGEELARKRIVDPREQAVRIGLDRLAGQEIELEFRVEPLGDNLLDYLFLAEPIVRVPESSPARVIVVFIDTLRHDALSLYGYDRPTSPGIDAWAENAAVFEQARSVAPWTLPTTRTMFTGAQPERWAEVTTLQEKAASAGWATAFIAGNVYLSSTFEMDRGFGLHRFLSLPRADVQLGRAREWLREVDDQPAFLVVHLMDAHLPYDEPRAFRRRFAGETPDLLGGDRFVRRTVVEAQDQLGEDGKQYLRDRYDNNVAWIDDQLGPFLAELRPEDLVVLLSDHGEEFWEHEEFEHGHSLYDEVLRVPLIIAGPGIPAGRQATPVSMLDVAPTLALHMGLSIEGMDGLPLQGLLDGSERERFARRPIGFGRLLYGERLWGVTHQGLKLISGRGIEQVFALGSDADEQSEARAAHRDRLPTLVQVMDEALGAEIVTALRLVPGRSRSERHMRVELNVPGGVRRAWVADDPHNLSEVEVYSIDDSSVRITWLGRARSEREVYVLPNLPLDQALPTITGTVQHRTAPSDLIVAETAGWPQPWDGREQPLLRGRSGGRTVVVDYARVPLPVEERRVLSGVDAEVNEDLKALGYVE